jgi:uncharacterized membrane protein YbhN (UPF0104 family)
LQPHRRPSLTPVETTTTIARGAKIYHAPPDRRPPFTRFFQDWFWWLLKNVIGWALILLAPVLGVLVPGPGGLPIFLIGFALVTFPGKRRLTARILYGRPLPLSARLVSWIAGVLAVTVPAVIFWWLAKGQLAWVQELVERPLRQIIPAAAVGYLLTMIVVWLLTRLILWVTNWLIRLTPKVRRKMRPWLRKHGINLLPPRGTRRGEAPADIEQEIIEFDPRHRDRLERLWKASKPWLRRLIGVVITAWIAANIYRRLSHRWHEIEARVLETSVPRLLIAAVMFAAFLFVFRALVWRRILRAFGAPLPVAPATRVWALSELARYLPGAIWQVLGRAYLVRPYGVRGSVSSASQLMEIAIFILANLLVATACIPWFAGKLTADAAAQDHGVYVARTGLFLAVACVPLFLTLLIPRVFYGLMDRVMRALGKDPFPQRLPMRALLAMLGWNILGLLWQTLALWIMLSPQEALGLKLSKFPLIAGAYCLAWFIGFIAFWAPGGIGVREIVLVAALRFALPPYVMQQFGGDRASYDAFLLFVGMLLRLWTILGELILSASACAVDYKGLTNQPNAPGRPKEMEAEVMAS